ncbi:MAG: LSM domain-containing protein [Sulfolobales archaeon]|nr:ribonucleoprotein [Sulfolobales archaeon]MCX8208553.1 ribonucleoprotein [Sulfolobales archaeon]MDW8011055.1 LSM domain-containing protein [Sulfolobales archaeon]
MLRAGIAKSALVKVKNGSAYVGRLVMVDSTMNVVLSDCREIAWNNENPEVVADYGTVLIRGSQIVYIAINYEFER